MNERIERGPATLPFGYTTIAKIDEKHANMQMDFALLKLKKNETFSEQLPLECIYLLISGDVEFMFDNKRAKVSREDCFDHAPWVLHVSSDTSVSITGISEEAELSIHRTHNVQVFESRLYHPQDIPDEIRGEGTMHEAGTRTVRTVLDKTLAPWSNFVFGEVITYPGKWSSYPPHIHPQPEIYFYKLKPEHGYGFCEYGDDVYKVRNNDTVFIEPDYTHPQVAAPGYALWYMWVIRQSDVDPYLAPTYPHFIEEHNWVRQEGAVIWKRARV